MKRLFLAALLIFPLLPLATAQDPGKIRFDSRELAENVHMVTSRAGGNLCICTGEDGVLLVDSDYTQLAEKAAEAIAAICDEPVRLVVNTHWHFDHTGGNAHFAGKGAMIVAHENVRKRLAAGQLISIINTSVPPAPEEALPVMTFKDSLTFRLNGEEIAVIHLPGGHTDGDSIVHFRKANVIHTGDLVFNGGYPFIDISSGGGIDGMIASVETVLQLCDGTTRIIPGHGPLMDRSDLKAYVAMLKDFRAAIAKEIAAGKDLAAVLEAKATASIDEKWGQTMFPAPVFTEIVYRSLTDE